MTQHINKIACILALIIFYSCSESKDIKTKSKENISTKIDLKEILPSIRYINFIGSKIVVSKTQPKEYSEEQAEEILKHLKISISLDSVKVGVFCKFKFFREFYDVHKMKYNTESLIVNECNLLNTEAISISNFNGTNEGCGTPYSKLIQSKNKIIYFDGGYFFSFVEAQPYIDDSCKIKELLGIIGDTRQEWKIVYAYSNNLENTYKDFVGRFPFGSIGVDKNIILNNKFDKINDIQYTYQTNLFQIKKNISVGSIYIKFKPISQNLTEVEYYLSFPFENSDYDG